MARLRPLPDRLDLKKLNEMAEPITVRVSRKRPGSAAEPIPLPEGGIGWTRSMVQGLEQALVQSVGGGTFHAQVYDNNGQVFEWEFFHPAKSVMPAETRVAAEQAEANARAAHAQAVQQLGTAPQQGHAPTFLPAPPTNPWNGLPLGVGGAPTMPPPAWQPQHPPPPSGWAPGMQPAPPSQQQQPLYQYDAYGRLVAVAAPWYQQPPLPPLIPPTPLPPQGADPQVMAKLQALEAQNAQLREAEIRRESNAAVTAMMSELRQYQTATDQRFTAMMEKLTTLLTGPRAQDDVQRRLDQEAQARQRELERLEAQRREDALRAEMGRIADRARESEERFRQEMMAARDSKNGELMQQLIAQQQQAQSQAQSQMQGLIATFLGRELKPEALIALMKEMTPGKDPIAEKLYSIAIDNLMSGGTPSTAQIIADSIGRVVETGKDVATAVLESKAAEEKRKAVETKQLQARGAQLAQQARQVVVAQPAPLPRNGAAPAAVNNGVAGAPPPAAAAVPSEADMTAAQVLEVEERQYFGDAYSQVSKLRTFVAKGLVTPQKAAEVLCEAWIYFTSMEVAFPALVDLGQRKENGDFEIGDLHKVVTRALPDAEPKFRTAVIQALPDAINSVILGAGEDEGEEESEVEEGAEAPVEG